MEHFKSPHFRTRVEQLLKQHHTPGLAIAIVQNGEFASHGFGQMSIDPPVSVTADTLFDVASSSKSLTAAALALLIDDRNRYPELTWESPVSSLLPDDFVIPGSGYTESVTIDDIISHRSGMARHDYSYLSPRAAEPDNARSVTRNLRNLPCAAPLRTKFIYCNMMYTVITHLLENITGSAFPDFLEEKFFNPLQMSSSHLQPRRARARGLGDRLATGYCWNKDQKAYVAFQSPDAPGSQGAGCIMTSVNDFIKWVYALVNRSPPLNDGVYQNMVRARTIMNPDAKKLRPFTSPEFYAAGLWMYWYRGHHVVGHDGGVQGFGSQFLFLPDLKFGLCIFGNSSDAGIVAGILSRELIDEVMQIPKAERRYRKQYVRGPHPAKSTPKSEEDNPDLASSDGSDQDADDAKHDQKTSETVSQQLPRPLSDYVGTYHHAGYHDLVVAIEDDKLFINATDRDFGFIITFEPPQPNEKFKVNLRDWLEGTDRPVDAEFTMSKNWISRLGIKLDDDYDDMIWFDRID